MTSHPPPAYAGPAGADPEQDKWLDDANENVKKQAFFMKRALDANNIRHALKCASGVIGELRTSKLSPRNYYEIYMNVTDELRELEMFFEDEDKKETQNPGTGRSIIELYENVQHAGNILPRLYLLITVAAVYIKSKKAPAKDILFDLVELCRGVQHPMRGLFLRNYLSQMAKDKLPDAGSEYEGVGGSVNDAIEFILQNFAEMNKLWVRMQHQGAVKDKARRETERRNLRQLVGTNLVRLSEMAGVDMATYKNVVLSRVLEQVVNCRDAIAQEYLMDCIIQVFPDEFHLATLETYLSTCAQLQEQVNVKNILITLMSRLANYVQEHSESVNRELEMFPLFHKYSSKIITQSPKMPLTDILALQVALVNFSAKVYPSELSYIDAVLGFTAETVKQMAVRLDPKCVRQIVELLSLPLEALSLRIIDLENYAPLLSVLELDQRKNVAINIAESVLRARCALDSTVKVDTLFKYLTPLIRDENEGHRISDDERFDFEREQQLMARLFHFVASEDTDEQFKLYGLARKHFGHGGTQRIEFTLPPMVYGSLQLAQRTHAREQKGEEMSVKTKKVLGFVHETISVLTPHFPELALRMFMQAARCADLCGKAFELIAYEFVAQALVAYEEEIADSKQQFAAINYISASLQHFTVFDKERYDTLATKATQHSAKLLKPADACRAYANCSHLYWSNDENSENRDAKRVLVCLQRALKIANTCMGSQVHLFNEILNKYLYFFDRGCPTVTARYIRGLIQLIDEHLPSLDADEPAALAIKQHYDNTLRHIKIKLATEGESGPYHAINQEDEPTESA